jgi:hypothetical protein
VNVFVDGIRLGRPSVWDGRHGHNTLVLVCRLKAQRFQPVLPLVGRILGIELGCSPFRTAVAQVKVPRVPTDSYFATEFLQRSFVFLCGGLIVQVEGPLGREAILYLGLVCGVSWSNCQQIYSGERDTKEQGGSDSNFTHETTPLR